MPNRIWNWFSSFFHRRPPENLLQREQAALKREYLSYFEAKADEIDGQREAFRDLVKKMRAPHA